MASDPAALPYGGLCRIRGRVGSPGCSLLRRRSRIGIRLPPGQSEPSPAGSLAVVTYVVLPVSVPTLLVLLPSAALLGVAMNLTAGSFKKHLKVSPSKVGALVAYGDTVRLARCSGLE